MNTAAVIKAIDLVLAGINLLRILGINYREVIEAQERAEAEGRELSAEERQVFIDQAQEAIDQL